MAPRHGAAGMLMYVLLTLLEFGLGVYSLRQSARFTWVLDESEPQTIDLDGNRADVCVVTTCPTRTGILRLLYFVGACTLLADAMGRLAAIS
ncbi:MAG: hypothetical protein ACPG4T_19830 [Nannocystaceae bacterium]